jgi:hypothetical protein
MCVVNAQAGRSDGMATACVGNVSGCAFPKWQAWQRASIGLRGTTLCALAELRSCSISMTHKACTLPCNGGFNL